MKNFIDIKKVAPIAFVMVLVFAVLNFGSYNANNELGSLLPSSALATNGTGGVAGTCDLSASSNEIYAGSDLDISWAVTGFAKVYLNGQELNNLSGTITIDDLQNDTTYTLFAESADGNSNCTSEVQVNYMGNPPATAYCELTLEKSVSSTKVNPGDEITYTINIKNTGTTDCTGGGVRILDVVDQNVTFISETHTSNLDAGYGSTPLYVPSSRKLWWNGHELSPGEEGTITWTGKVVDGLACDTYVVVENTAKATAKELNNFNDWSYSNTVETTVGYACEVPAPKCEFLNATPDALLKGNSADLNWSTLNANRVVIDNGIGEVSATGTLSVTPLATTEYLLTAFGDDDKRDTCSVTLTVEEPPVLAPACTLSPATKTIASGESVDLIWTTTNATSAVLTDLGNVAFDGTENTGALTANKTYQLDVLGTNGETVSCTSEITVESTPIPLSCANNVNLSMSPASIKRGQAATLAWSTTGVTSLSFDGGINSTSLSGSISVSPTSDTTYTLTATDGIDTISCPIPVVVTSGGGGGGGSSSPTCELSVSDVKIKHGEEIELVWKSSRATELKIVDDSGEVLVTTEDKLSKDKIGLFDGSLTLSPTKDTTYTMNVERGSRDRICTAKVEVEGDTIVVKQVRDQQPLIASISLAEVPYTGFEAGPILTVLFYTLLMLWALYIAYLMVVRPTLYDDDKLVTTNNIKLTNSGSNNISPTTVVENVGADTSKTDTAVVESAVPANLPIAPVIGYANLEDNVSSAETSAHMIDDEEVTRIENYAHTEHVLLSSDAIRHFVGKVDEVDERLNILSQIIKAAKSQIPAEEGWIVINEKRMIDLCKDSGLFQVAEKATQFIPTVMPEGSGSLAEAIVTGNVVAAYEMIGHRPMFALADAAADLDSVYRTRKGNKEVVSDMLLKETESLSDEQLLDMIKALTGALDGTYTDEASAVKVAIMKAVKVVTHA
ncbi:MAG: DUF11 domain-containing protein [Candidatus Nomurabacteria bacterium]|nr:MAG: DUF11 domain-containing protein [Candidatus Nomurabacteria bacterium]